MRCVLSQRRSGKMMRQAGVSTVHSTALVDPGAEGAVAWPKANHVPFARERSSLGPPARLGIRMVTWLLRCASQATAPERSSRPARLLRAAAGGPWAAETQIMASRRSPVAERL